MERPPPAWQVEGRGGERLLVRPRCAGSSVPTRFVLARRVEADAGTLVLERESPSLLTMVCQPSFLQLAPVATVSVMVTLSMAGPKAPAVVLANAASWSCPSP